MIPNGWTPGVRMDRIICHWTAGGHRADGRLKRYAAPNWRFLIGEGACLYA